MLALNSDSLCGCWWSATAAVPAAADAAADNAAADSVGEHVLLDIFVDDSLFLRAVAGECVAFAPCVAVGGVCGRLCGGAGANRVGCARDCVRGCEPGFNSNTGIAGSAGGVTGVSNNAEPFEVNDAGLERSVDKGFNEFAVDGRGPRVRAGGGSGGGGRGLGDDGRGGVVVFGRRGRSPEKPALSSYLSLSLASLIFFLLIERTRTPVTAFFLELLRIIVTAAAMPGSLESLPAMPSLSPSSSSAESE